MDFHGFFYSLARSYENDCPSPDGSGILFIFSLKIKRYKRTAGNSS